MSRRQKRYERRMQKRTDKLNSKVGKNLNFDAVCDFEALYNSAFKAAKGVRWKISVQRYLLNVLINTVKLQRRLEKLKDVRQGFIKFIVNERGKVRHISSVHFRERVVQKALCTYAFSPVISRSLITDNGASQKGKGTTYAINRITSHLRKHCYKNGNKGYILLIDFKSYFDNINHEKLKEVFRKFFDDEKILKYTDDFINAFGDKGLGLGSETSQTGAIVFINDIDHFIKEKLSIKAYGRYMDDSYIILPSKNALEDVLQCLIKKYEEFGITVNKKKTYITDLKHGFMFLKTRFYITDTNFAIKKACRDSIVRERRKLKRQAKLYEQGILTKDDIHTSFVAWEGSLKRKHAKTSVRNMKLLYNSLFTKGEMKND